MPRKPPSPCNAPGCRAVCVGRYCEHHAHLAAGWRRSKRAGQTTKRMSGKGLQLMRARIFKRDNYLCQCSECKSLGRVRVAHEVDHVVPLAEGGTNDDANLRAINRDCHRRKTEQESLRGRKK